jgi:hypothetical protein
MSVTSSLQALVMPEHQFNAGVLSLNYMNLIASYTAAVPLIVLIL